MRRWELGERERKKQEDKIEKGEAREVEGRERWRKGKQRSQNKNGEKRTKAEGVAKKS